MKKSVYSLILMDNVVKAVDKIAYSNKTNRSNMINQILAEYCSCITPEMRMKNIFSRMEESIDHERFQNLDSSSDSIFTLRSALEYKYNPSVRYHVELYRDSRNDFGALRVQFRTQNQQLIDELTSFFRLWAAIESEQLEQEHRNLQPDIKIESGKFERKFVSPASEDDCSSETLADSISSYLQYFDMALKQFFQDRMNEIDPQEDIKSIYHTYLKKTEPII